MARLRVNADAFARLVAAVGVRPRSYKTLGEETGLHYTTVRDYINALHKHQQVHIAGWETDSRGQYSVPQFLLGFGQDVPSPKMSAAERKRRQRTRENALVGKPPSRPKNSKRPVINSVFALGDRVR